MNYFYHLKISGRPKLQKPIIDIKRRMALVNENYLKLPEKLFIQGDSTSKINVFKTMRPKSDMIHLDFGDSKKYS